MRPCVKTQRNKLGSIQCLCLRNRFRNELKVQHLEQWQGGRSPRFQKRAFGGGEGERWVEMVEERGGRKERETETEESNHVNAMAWLPSLQPPGLHGLVSRVFCLVGFCLLKYP